MVKKMSRREFIKTCTNTAAASIVLTACGNMFSRDAHAQMKVDEVQVGEANLITTLSDLKAKTAINFVYAGKKSILLYNDGNIKAYENICTHRRGPTNLEGDELVCKWHGAWFDPKTGSAIRGPARVGSKLTEIKIKNVNGTLFVDT